MSILRWIVWSAVAVTGLFGSASKDLLSVANAAEEKPLVTPGTSGEGSGMTGGG